MTTEGNEIYRGNSSWYAPGYLSDIEHRTLFAPRGNMSDEFRLAPGFFVLNETSMRGDVPRHDRDTLELYKAADSLRKRAFYTIVKHCVSTPFGYFIHDAGREALAEEMVELHEEAESYNNLVGDSFRCYINLLFVRADPEDAMLRRRMAQFIAERLESMKERLLTMDPRKDKKALVYTQDQTKRLDICLQGVYAKLVRKAIDEGLNLAHEIKVDPSKQQSLTFPALDGTIDLLEKLAETL